jgi:hypothetical protein
MKPKRQIIGENEKEVIKQIAVGLATTGFIASSLVIPNLPVALQPILKMRGNKGLQKLIKKLKNKNIIDLGGEKIKLTTHGQKILREIKISEITINEPESWDGNWHLVAYDIPEKYKKLRQWFRELLEKNGFYQIQKSLWVHPFECKEEIAIICKELNILPYVVIMKTDKLPNEEKMIDRFGLRD